MPIYDYRCEQCGHTYDVFHKGREVAEDVVCPSCGSLKHRKLMSTPGKATFSSGSVTGSDFSGGSYGGGCASGMCGLG